tara:strand:- start:1655 stop:2455 length:801 start_codon:yes stop_codon:yes gene_type:complete
MNIKLIRLAIICLVLLISPASVLAQVQESMTPNKIKSFGLSGAHLQLKEENLHPKVHSALAAGLNYQSIKWGNSLRLFRLDLGYARPKTFLEAVGYSVNARIQAQYQYLRTIKKANNWHYLSGAQALASYQINYYPNWDDSHLYWANQFNLGWANRLYFFTESKGSWILSSSLSVLSLYSRPEALRQYKIDDLSPSGILSALHSNMNLGSLNRNLNLNLACEYRFKLSAKHAQSIGYSYSYQRSESDISRLFQSSVHSLSYNFYFL